MNIKKMTGISLFASISYVLSYLSFPVLPYIPFLKLDFSDLPVLIGTFSYGPLSGTLIAFIRSFMHYLLTGGELGFPIGDTAAFLASISFVLPLYFYLTKDAKVPFSKVKAGIVGTLGLTFTLTILNWFVLVPAYSYVLNFDVGPMKSYLLYGVIPFNLIKGAVLSAAFFLLLKNLQPFMMKNKKKR